MKTYKELRAQLEIERSPSCPDRHNYCPAEHDNKETKACAYLADSTKDRAALRAQCLAIKSKNLTETHREIEFWESGKGDFMVSLDLELNNRAPSEKQKKVRLFQGPKL